MSQELLDKWLLQTEPGAFETLKVPLSVLLDEAPVVAAFVRNRWEPTEGAERRQPGLGSAVKARAMAIPWSLALAGDILELQAATQFAQNQYVLESQPVESPATERAEFVLRELIAALEWFYDDGVEDEHDAQLEMLDQSVGDAATIAELASALEGYAAVGAAVRSEIDGVIGFDAAMIDEAPELARQLRERNVPTDPEAQAQALDRRRRVASLLQERMQLVRRAARVVFRHHPEIAREPASAYRRRQRAARRRAQERAQQVAEAASPVEG